MDNLIELYASHRTPASTTAAHEDIFLLWSRHASRRPHAARLLWRGACPRQQNTPGTLRREPPNRARLTRCHSGSAVPSPEALAAAPEDAQWFAHAHDAGLPQGLALEVAATVLGALAASRLLDVLAQLAAKKVKESKARGLSLGGLLASAVVAAQRPLSLFLPVKASLRVAVLLVESLEQAAHMLSTMDTPRWQIQLLERMCDGIHTVDRLANKSFNTTLLMLIMWAVLRLKDVVVNIILDKAASLDDPSERLIDNLLLPLSTLSTWLVFGGIGLMVMRVLGLNIRPLLAAGGVGGVVLGLATQSLLANALAGLHLARSLPTCNSPVDWDLHPTSTCIAVRPMVVGERVSVRGTVTVTGVVEQIDFLRTVIRTDAHVPHHIPNKALVDAVISNESRTQLSTVRATYSHTRQLAFCVRLLHSDLPKVEAIVARMQEHFQRGCPGCETSLPISVGLSDALNSHAITISVRVHSTPAAARRWSAWRQEVFLKMHEILGEAGATVAPSVAEMAFS